MSKRKLKRRRKNPAQEHILLVGAPSNTFNGYYHWETSDAVAETPPADTSPTQIYNYTHGTGGFGPDHWQRTTSHDVYWANFIYAAVKAVEIREINPARGDILTFILWVPGLLERFQTDWTASPYNTQLHSSSAWVAGNKPYKKSVLASQQGTGTVAPRTKPPDPSTITYSTAEPDIDLEILMTMTSEGDADGGFHKRPHAYNDYESAIADIPRRIVHGSSTMFPTPLPVPSTVPEMPEVLVKLLLMTDVQQLYDYLETGAWPAGDQWLHWMDIYDESDMANMNTMAEASWAAYGHMKKGRTYPDWDSAPSVDRSRVKIKRFDYFGHSGPGTDHGNEDAFWLEYGVSNAKGTLPGKEVIVNSSELDTHLSESLFASGATSTLWGCNLGHHMARMLAGYMGSVKACEGLTSFNHILDDGTGLPVPADETNAPFIIYVGP